MNKYIVLLLCICFNFISAQLSVRNDAYIFASDEVVFVNDDINLGELNSRFFLRNEAQLLQGDGNTGNSGIGLLSVYQTGNVNQWSYNYWCSPVGNNSAINGNEINRVNLINDATGLITAAPALFTPAFNGTASPLTISARWLYTFTNSVSYNDWVYVGSDGEIAPGLGFTMKGNGTGIAGSQLYDFRGKPNNGTITNDVSTGVNTLIGNPYPSAIDSALFIHDADNQASITGTLLFWEQDGTVASHVLQDYRGGYYSFTIDASGTLITDAPAVFQTYDEDNNIFPLPIPFFGTKSTGRYIPIGQGFMVEGIAGTPASPASVYVKNSHRVFAKESDGQSNFFRNNLNEDSNDDGVSFQDNGLSIVPPNFKRFRINVDFEEGNDQFTRQLILNFNENATAGFDYGMELITSEISGSDAYFSLDGKTFIAQAYPFSEELRIPLSINTASQQPLRFRIFDIQNFDENQSIFLHDLETNQYINLRENDYELNIEAGNYSDRFEILFSNNNTLSTEDVELKTFTIKQDVNQKKILVFNPNLNPVDRIEIFDLNGRAVVSYNKLKTVAKTEIDVSQFTSGVYIISLSEEGEVLKSQKVIITN
ncbi:T9SS type A sorting domain-containing protein [Winogradskyella poriferorum]|uniref:T9SS type A sorting domain-containing protein n=1 Tax=Winogradskyella poriferorum TaxID=307627 RepID=UPI003D64F9CC